MQGAAVAGRTCAVEDRLALLFELGQLGIGIGKGVEPEAIASAKLSTPGDENNVCWNAARSSSMLLGGSMDTCACANSAPRACSWSVANRASC